MSKTEYSELVTWVCACENWDGEGADDTRRADEIECQVCHQKRPKSLDPVYVMTVDKNGSLSAVYQLGDRPPVLDKPNGPAWYWYEHPPTSMGKCNYCHIERVVDAATEEGDTCKLCNQGQLVIKKEQVDPCIMEVGIQGTDFRVEWKGVVVSLDQLRGRWQRVVPGVFS